MPLRATSVAFAVAAIGFAGVLAGAQPASAAGPAIDKATSFSVCGPRGCPSHSTTGTITWAGAQSAVKGTLSDHGPGSTVLKVRYTPAGTTPPPQPIYLAEGSRTYSVPVPNATLVTISVCSGTLTETGPCVNKAFRTA